MKTYQAVLGPRKCGDGEGEGAGAVAIDSMLSWEIEHSDCAIVAGSRWRVVHRLRIGLRFLTPHAHSHGRTDRYLLREMGCHRSS